MSILKNKKVPWLIGDGKETLTVKRGISVFLAVMTLLGLLFASPTEAVTDPYEGENTFICRVRVPVKSYKFIQVTREVMEEIGWKCNYFSYWMTSKPREVWVGYGYAGNCKNDEGVASICYHENAKVIELKDLDDPNCVTPWKIDGDKYQEPRNTCRYDRQ